MIGMIYDNINILGSTGSHVYIIGHESNYALSDSSNLIYENINGNIEFFDKMDDNSYIRNNDEYIKFNSNGTSKNIPTSPIHTTNIKVFFPDYSVDTYVPGTRYAVLLSTWINGKQIILGTKILDRLDTVASDIILDEKDYNEYISFDIIDPYYLVYGDEWKDFRINVCGELKNQDGTQMNTTGSFLYCSLQPLEKIEDHYILLDGYTGGHNALNISNPNTDYLNCIIKDNINEPNSKGDILINCNLFFSDIYNNDLYTYLKETYNVENTYLVYKLMLFDGDNVYNKYVESEHINITQELKSYSYNFENDKLDDIFGKVSDADKDKITMKTYKDGFRFVVVALIKNKADDETLLHIISNDIILPKEKFTYFIRRDEEELKYIELDNMNITKINAINKIENKIIQIDKPEDSKSNIIMPVFFKVNDLANIVIHPEVNENISINLDIYKSKVNSFIIQIEGIQFAEIGRTDAGVIFKIAGKKLPREVNGGTYYILNEKQDMIVSGKYKYEV